jgi:CO/xanthine dehydrogenase FAD-binding subunit
MINLQEILKPTTIADAMKLLQQPGTFALAGGTALNADARRDVIAVVDLSALGLSYVKEASGNVAIGATTTLAALSESPILRALANGVVAQAAHRSASSILRNQATIACTLIVESDGVLAVALLALDARVTSPPSPPLLLGEGAGGEVGFLTRCAELLKRGALVTEIAVPMTNPRASLQTVARTPSDEPIVRVVASARIEKGIARDVRIALGGVGDIALRASAAEKALEGQTLNDMVIENVVGAFGRTPIQPRGDFRGSAEYSKEMAVVLTRRAVGELIR